ncbi:chorismate mutase [Aquincola sp. S2]|uniref:chorismate mutase n=2 Tax=Pseudaquabacterium terrae TaxID=2732868 RepID=A0ABX2EU69_9BURK|nr:chorismate mutase [Aquabacterium terrae]NRF72143.1 chorismate mutase [Aquabacterium terrae]
MPNDELNALRADIDAVDARIIDLLAQRFRITERVGDLKASSALAPVDAVREAAQMARYHALATAAGIAPAVVTAVFRTIIDEVVREHARRRS